MEGDQITEIPNIEVCHGIFPDKRDRVDAGIDQTTRVFCGGEFHVPPVDRKDVAAQACQLRSVDALRMDIR